MSQARDNIETLMTSIENPHNHDVLCGRGGAIYKHVGNYTFRYLVLLNKNIYFKSKKSEKIRISRSLVTAIHGQIPPGRFLKQDPESGLWNEISEKRAIEKTSQALREGQGSSTTKQCLFCNSDHVEYSEENEKMLSIPISASVKSTTIRPSHSDSSINSLENSTKIDSLVVEKNECIKEDKLLKKKNGVDIDTNNTLSPASKEQQKTEILEEKKLYYDEEEINNLICQTFSSQNEKEQYCLIKHNIPKLPSMNHESICDDDAVVVTSSSQQEEKKKYREKRDHEKLLLDNNNNNNNNKALPRCITNSVVCSDNNTKHRRIEYLSQQQKSKNQNSILQSYYTQKDVLTFNNLNFLFNSGSSSGINNNSLHNTIQKIQGSGATISTYTSRKNQNPVWYGGRSA